jgi:hypothetical protein
MRPFVRQIGVVALVSLLAAACGSHPPPVHLQPSVLDPGAVDVAQLDRSIVTVDAPGICPQPKVQLGSLPVTPVFAAADRLFVPGTPVVSGVLDVLRPEWKTQCEWSAEFSLSVDCAGQSPIGSEDEEGLYAAPIGSTGLTLQKRLIPAEVLPRVRADVSTWTTVAVRFPSTAISEPLPAESIQISNVAASLTSGSWRGDSFVYFFPDEPLAADTEYTVTLAGGLQGPRNTVGGCLAFAGTPSQTFTFRTRAADQLQFRLEAERKGVETVFTWDEIPGARIDGKVRGSQGGYSWSQSWNTATYTGLDGCVSMTATLGKRQITSNEICTKDLP